MKQYFSPPDGCILSLSMGSSGSIQPVKFWDVVLFPAESSSTNPENKSDVRPYLPKASNGLLQVQASTWKHGQSCKFSAIKQLSELMPRSICSARKYSMPGGKKKNNYIPKLKDLSISLVKTMLLKKKKSVCVTVERPHKLKVWFWCILKKLHYTSWSQFTCLSSDLFETSIAKMVVTNKTQNVPSDEIEMWIAPLEKSVWQNAAICIAAWCCLCGTPKLKRDLYLIPHFQRLTLLHLSMSTTGELSLNYPSFWICSVCCVLGVQSIKNFNGRPVLDNRTISSSFSSFGLGSCTPVRMIPVVQKMDGAIRYNQFIYFRIAHMKKICIVMSVCTAFTIVPKGSNRSISSIANGIKLSPLQIPILSRTAQSR